MQSFLSDATLPCPTTLDADAPVLSPAEVKDANQLFYGFSDREVEALTQFRAKLPDADASEHDDMTCMRFIRARKLNVEKAVDMYQQWKVWRRNNQVDRVLESPPSNVRILQMVAPQGIHGHDKNGRPVYWQKVGKLYLDEIMHFSCESIFECQMWSQELRSQAAKRAAKV